MEIPMQIFLVLLFTTFYTDPAIASVADYETEEEFNDDIDHVCEDTEGHYVKFEYYGVTCCGKRRLYSPFSERSPSFIKCHSELSIHKDDDLPTSAWRIYSCVLNDTGGIVGSTSTFGEFLTFMTKNYTSHPEIMAQILKNAGTVCDDADKETDDITKIEKYHICLYRAERKTCHNPLIKLNETDDLDTYRDDNDVEFCKPVEDFPEYSTGCKGRYVPISLLEFESQNVLVIDAVEGKNENCSASFVYRQKELDPELKDSQEVYKLNLTDYKRRNIADECTTACEMGSKGYDGNLNFDIRSAESKLLFPDFTTATKRDLNFILDNYAHQFKFILPDNETVSIFEVENAMKTRTDELIRIQTYCNMFEFVAILSEGAYKEYCYGKEYGQAWTTEMINSMYD